MEFNFASELNQLFTNYLAETDIETDEKTVRSFMEASPQDRREKALAQARQLRDLAELPLEAVGIAANRWFADEQEARAWLDRIIAVLESGASGGQVVVKDSNGAPLSEGDSVLVIKDLKVKGGSSDLKRGTLIKKIHLIDDPDMIECRVDGSTLVLKTCFLKKA